MIDFTIEIYPHCVSEQVDSQAIILNIETGMYYELNQIGTVIWNEIKAKKIKKSTLIARLHKKFDRKDLAGDISEFLESMLEKQVILRKDI